MPPLTFGVNISTSSASGANPARDAQTAEALGFDFVSASDHPSGPHPTFEAWTMLTWVAAATNRASVVSRVLSTPFRAPALVAKMAESLDRLSGGRLVLGLGAGATDNELHGFGLNVPSAGAKVDGLEDALHVVRGLWAEPGYTYEGRVYRTYRAEMEPKPARPIPIWLGTFGHRALALTGRLADGSIPSLGYAPLAELPAMRDRVMAAAVAAGRGLHEVTCALNLEVAVTQSGGMGPDVIAGPPLRIAEHIRQFVALGFTAFNFMPVGPYPESQTELLATEVVPAVREPA